MRKGNPEPECRNPLKGCGGFTKYEAIMIVLALYASVAFTIIVYDAHNGSSSVQELALEAHKTGALEFAKEVVQEARAEYKPLLAKMLRKGEKLLDEAEATAEHTKTLLNRFQ